MINILNFLQRGKAYNSLIIKILNNIKYRLAIFIFLFGTLQCAADSPLTSISFWNISDNPMVQKTGCLNGLKNLNNKTFNFLVNLEIAVFHKIALVNALGWEFDGNSPRNSKVFLNALEMRSLNLLKNHGIDDFYQDYNNENDAKFNRYKGNVINKQAYNPGYKDIIKTYASLTGSNSNDIYLVYLYLAAMDNYWDVSLIYEELNKVGYEYDSKFNKEVELDTEESFKFVKMLVSSQHSLLEKGISYDVWEQFDSYLLQGSTSNEFIKRTLPIAHKYLSSYKEEK
ncbi:hypothetical protein N8387_09305 [Polaribacter sp.]|nr:hypothetical protein [Polaribacter sp.]